MTNLSNALQELREQRKEAQSQLEKLNEAISAIEGLVTKTSSMELKGARPSRTVSAAARRRMARAQRARWAKVRKGTQSVGKAVSVSPGKRTLSIASRRKIAAAQRARWAQVRAQQGKKAA
jgi:hypothetical protein